MMDLSTILLTSVNLWFNLKCYNSLLKACAEVGEREQCLREMSVLFVVLLLFYLFQTGVQCLQHFHPLLSFCFQFCEVF